MTIEHGKLHIGFLGILTTIFVVLKLTDNIDWSWWWVLAPLWAPFTAVACGVFGAATMFFIFKTIKRLRNK